MYRKHNIDIKNYQNWNYDNITDWIISLDDGIYEKYEKILREQLKDEEMSGDVLSTLDKNDLGRFGIKNYKHKLAILNHIKKLTSKQNNNNNIMAFNEGNNQTAYIG